MPQTTSIGEVQIDAPSAIRRTGGVTIEIKLTRVRRARIRMWLTRVLVSVAMAVLDVANRIGCYQIDADVSVRE